MSPISGRVRIEGRFLIIDIDFDQEVYAASWLRTKHVHCLTDAYGPIIGECLDPKHPKHPCIKVTRLHFMDI